MASKTPLIEGFADNIQISHIEDGPFAFWITLESQSKHFHQILAGLNGERPMRYQGEFYKNQPVKVKYDQMFWRATMTNYNETEDMFEVLLPDKGLRVKVSADSLYDISDDYATVGDFAHLVTLHLSEETLNAKDPRIHDWFCQLTSCQSKFQMRIVTSQLMNRKASCELYLQGSQSMLAALQARMHMHYTDLPLDVNKDLEVQISSVTSKVVPWSFGARLASSEAELGSLHEDMQDFCENQAKALIAIPKPEEPIFTFYEGQWYRAKTQQVINYPNIHVELVDFGIRFIALGDDSCLADYRLVTKMPMQSFQCRLYGVDTLPLGQQFWDLTADRKFKIRVLDTLETEELVVNMFDTSVVPPVDIATRLRAMMAPECPMEKHVTSDYVWEQNSQSSGGRSLRVEQDFTSQQHEILGNSKQNRLGGGGDSASSPSYTGQEKGVLFRPQEMKQPLPATNAANHMPLRRPMQKPSISLKTPCFVVYTETPDDFYIQLEDWQKQIESTKAQIAHRCRDAAAPPFQTLFKGASCLARSQLDSAWYRAKVKEIYPSSKDILVKFTDYGNSEKVNAVTSVVSITPELDQIPPLVVHCSLLQACSQEQQWTDHDIEQFVATWEGKKLEVEFVEREVIGGETTWLVVLRDQSAAAASPVEHPTSRRDQSAAAASPVEYPTSRKLSPTYASEPPSTFQSQAPSMPPAVPQASLKPRVTSAPALPQLQTSTMYQASLKPQVTSAPALPQLQTSTMYQAATITTTAPALPQSQTNTMYQAATITTTAPALTQSQTNTMYHATTVTTSAPALPQTSTMYQAAVQCPPGFQPRVTTSTWVRHQGILPTPYTPTTYPAGMPPTNYPPNLIPPANTMYQANATFPSVQQPQSFPNTMGFPHGIAQNYHFQAMPYGNNMTFMGTPRFPPSLPMFRANATAQFQNPPAMMSLQTPLASASSSFPRFQATEAPSVQPNQQTISYQAPHAVQSAAQDTASTSYEANPVPVTTSTTYQEETVYSSDEEEQEISDKMQPQTAAEATPSVEPTTSQSKRLASNSSKRAEVAMYVPPPLRKRTNAPLSWTSPRPAAFDTTDSSDAAEPIVAPPRVLPKVKLVIPEMKLPTEESVVTISCFISPHNFYAQLTNRAAEYADLQSRLQKACASLSHPDPMQISKDDLVLAPRESVLHRARVVATKDDKAKCTFLDLGELTRVVRLASLLPLPAWACEDPVFSLPCKLAGVVPVGSAWEQERCQEIFDYSTEYLLTVLNAEEHEVELRCPESGRCVSQLLRKAGVATVPDQSPAKTVVMGTGEDFPVFVSFLQGDILHLQLANVQRKLELLQQLLQAAAPTLQNFNLGTNKHMSQLVAVRSQRDGQWYRALPLGSATTHGLPVYFVDLGPRDLVWEVRQLSPALASVQYLSVPARLPCVLKCDAYSMFDDVLESPTPVKMRVMHQGLDCLVCELEVTGSSLLEKLLDLSLATPLLGEAYMTYMESPRCFALQPTDLESSLQELEHRLATEQFQPLTSPPKVGDLCLAQFTDLSWYRAKVTSSDEPRVLFIDYGNSETVSELREMPADMTEIPAMAKFCELSVIRDNYEEHFMQLDTDDAFQVLWPTDMESQPLKVVLLRDDKDVMPATPHPLQFTLEGVGLSVPLGEQEPETTGQEVISDATDQLADDAQTHETEPEDSTEPDIHAAATDQLADDAQTLDTEPEDSTEPNIHAAATDQLADDAQTLETEPEDSTEPDTHADATEQQAVDSETQETENSDPAGEVYVSEEEEEACDQVKDMSDFWNDSGVEDKASQRVEECSNMNVSSEIPKVAMDSSDIPDNWEELSVDSSVTELETNAVRCKENVAEEADVSEVKPEDFDTDNVNEELEDTAVNEEKSEHPEPNVETVNKEAVNFTDVEFSTKLNERLQDVQTINHEIDELYALFGTVSLEDRSAPLDESDDFDEEPLKLEENNQVRWSLGYPDILDQYSRDSMSEGSRNLAEMNPCAEDFRPRDHMEQVSVGVMQQSLESLKQMESCGEKQIEIQQPVESSDKEEKPHQFPTDQIETELSGDHHPPQPFEVESLDDQQPMKEVESASVMSSPPEEHLAESPAEMSGEEQEVPDEYVNNQQPEALKDAESSCEYSEVQSTDDLSSPSEEHLAESPAEMSGEEQEMPDEYVNKPEALKDAESTCEYSEVQSTDDKNSQGENQQTSDPQVEKQEVTELEQVESTQEILQDEPENPQQTNEVASCCELGPQCSETLSLDAKLPHAVHTHSTESVKNQEVDSEPLIESSGDNQEATLEVPQADELALENQEAMQQQPSPELPSKKHESTLEILERMSSDDTLSESSVTSQLSILEELQLGKPEQVQSSDEIPSETQDDNQLMTEEVEFPVEFSAECQQTTDVTPPESLEITVSLDNQIATNCSQLFTIESTDESETSEDLDLPSAHVDFESCGIALYERQQLQIQLDSILEEARETVTRQVTENSIIN